MVRIHTNEPVREHGWIIETSAGVVQADGLSSTVPSVSKGESGTWEFRFYPDDFSGSAGSAGAGAHLYDYEDLLEYAPHAGRFVVERRATQNVAHYREQHTDESLLVRVTPASENPSTGGVWGLLAAVEDSSMLPGELAVIAVDIAYLADADQYDSHDEVSQALESTGP